MGISDRFDETTDRARGKAGDAARGKRTEAESRAKGKKAEAKGKATQARSQARGGAAGTAETGNRSYQDQANRTAGRAKDPGRR
ncbi:hypothetical protein LX16_1380 [Stackebrandtia albiflava]|uniref:Uncharacterized protein n=1 Tax=Stackebrandtia albiflava TaxID=406432 RepID=A0A562VCR5_9ACTN|nr:hypothetical protein [Stackebrandtia albiflava]TWJ15669.1 hypothetical protein LX16_1380 [Stackebrandtia albiflava]